MTGDGRSARFALVSDEDETVWATFADVSGFFTEADTEDGWPVGLLGCAVRGPLSAYCEGRLSAGKVRGNFEVRILDESGKVIGAYPVTVARALDCTASAVEPGRHDLTVELVYFEPPDPSAAPIWDRWRQDRPREKNLWTPYPTRDRWAWLDVVGRHLRWDDRRRADAPAGHVFELDGRHVTDEPGCYCAIGEAINGPGGYFGAHPYALLDCLRGGFGATSPFTLIWNDSDVARRHLREPASDRDGDVALFDEIVDLLRERGVTVELR